MADEDFRRRLPAWARRLRAGAAAGGLSLGLVLGLALAGGARAQLLPPWQSLGDLPVRPKVSPQVDPAPFDPYRAIKDYFNTRLPGGWRTGVPLQHAGGYTLVVFLPSAWRGNPTSAVMQFCPPRVSSLWQGGIPWIELQPFHGTSPWPPAMCRP